MKDINGGISAVAGVNARGIKQGKNGLAVIRAEGSAAGVFTRNKVIAPSLIITQQHLKGGKLAAVIANSGCANSFTGTPGLEDAKEMARLTAEKFGVEVNSVGVASTGVIGKRLDMDLIRSQFNEMRESNEDHEGSTAAAKAIMTTDTFPKEAAVELSNGTRIGGIAKGSGMIAPDMCTMLVFLYTDAKLDAGILKDCLQKAVNKSFNMVVVDGDNSTNDTVLITATGRSGPVDLDEFKQGLEHVCITLARLIAKDGEGATHLIEARVNGALNDHDAALAARTIVRSPLVKSAVFGKDPNWGRVVAAVGYSGAQVDQQRIGLAFADKSSKVKLVENGQIMETSDADLREIMGSEEIFIIVDLNLGSGSATAWGCDLTYDYVRINAEYTT
ncbi:MAG: bifunctional ornithine acetyltransferase/N-acetylglutamate synthase [Methanosarcinales archaeon]|nr:bifunctional ornithine acetyltransferase/N-acetylglutamate synthase [Methanosarcinales archaeon]